MSTARAYVKGRIAPRQVKAIHAAIGKLGMDDDTYRATLQERFGVKSCKGLSWQQAEELLDHLNGKPAKPRIGGKKRHADMDGRPGMASGAQCRMLEAMWSEVSRMSTAEEKERAFGRFLKRIAGVDGLRFLEGKQVEKVVKAIKVMKEEKESGHETA